MSEGIRPDPETIRVLPSANSMATRFRIRSTSELDPNMLDLVDHEKWEELEKRLQAALREDPTDARSAFRLGNLLTLESRYEEAVRRYDVAWTQRWPGVVCLNNKAVALARSGEARVAITLFRDVLVEDKSYAPAAYNLAILLDFLGEEDTRPGLILQLQLIDSDESTAGLVKKTFEAAAKGVGWGEGRHPLEGPFYLWHDDLKSGFGFEPNASEADIDEGYRYFQEGLDQLQAGRPQEAIDAFNAAEDFYPGLEARIHPHRTRALLEQAKDFRDKARRYREEGDFDAARDTLDTYFRLADSLPDQALAEELLVTQIRRLGEDLRQHQPSLHWEELQRLISMARHRVEDLEHRAALSYSGRGQEGAGAEPATAAEKEAGEPAGREADVGAAPEETPTTEGGDGAKGADEALTDQAGRSQAQAPFATAPESSRMGEYIRGLCRDACGQQLRFLAANRCFDGAELMLTFSEIQWFAQTDRLRWRRDIYTIKAEALASDATEALGQGKRVEAITLLNRAREAAMETGDSHLSDRLDQQIAQVERRRKPRIDLKGVEKLFEQGDYLEVLRQCTDKLEQTPDEPTVRSRRDSALHRLQSQVRGALRARHWKRALETTSAILKILPDDEETQDLAQEAQRGQLARLLSQARNAYAERDYDAAREACRKALEMDPVNKQALELRRLVEIAASVDLDAGEETYEKAFVEFEKARSAGNPKAAFEPLLTMRKVAPTTRPLTREATDWLARSLVAAYRRDLEQDRSSENSEKLLEALQDLLNLLPDDPTALAFRDELRREMEGYGQERRKRSLEQLNLVRKHLLDCQPVAALDVLENVVELGEPSLENDVEEYLGEALTQIRRRIRRLALTEEDPETGEPSEDGQDREDKDREDKDRLFRVLRRWDRDQAEQFQRSLKWEEQRSQRHRKIDEAFGVVQNAVDREESSLSALKVLYREVLSRHRAGSDLLKARRQELAELRRRHWAALGRFGRWRAWLYERIHQVDRLFEEEEGDGS